MHVHIRIPLPGLKLTGLQQAKPGGEERDGNFKGGEMIDGRGFRWKSEEKMSLHTPFVSEFYDPDIMSATTTTVCQTM
ncbi:hypothetical protein OIU85_014834 [Salix viminalis]|uniref:Uncharacterized protein n=1 Tax=Salix viminalis TaxID=40686 RepID=A0A9Q0NJY3_SALVM|nr:hypothetical protein OIU85_014834 [Salix viminalis]